MKKRMTRLMALGLVVCMISSPMLHVHAEDMESAAVAETVEEVTEPAVEEKAEPVQEASTAETKEESTDIQEEKKAESADISEETKEEPKTETSTEAEQVMRTDSLQNDAKDAEDIIGQTADAVVPNAPAVSGSYPKLVKSDGSLFEGLVSKDTSSSVNNGKDVTVTIDTAGKSFNGLRLGYSTDDNMQMMNGLSFESVGEACKMVFHVDASKAGTVQPVVLHRQDGTWYTDEQLWLYIPQSGSVSGSGSEAEGESAVTDTESSEAEQSKLDAGKKKKLNHMFDSSDSLSEKFEESMRLFDAAEPQPITVADGNYSAEGECGVSTMFRIVKSVISVHNGQAVALITLSGEGYDYLYMGTEVEAVAEKDTSNYIKPCGKEQYIDESGSEKTGNQFKIPVSSLEQPIQLSAHGVRSGQWYYRPVQFHADTSKTVAAPIPSDGTYTTTAETGEKMFKVVDTQITVKDGEMTAVVTLSGTGYDYLYLGTGAEAGNTYNSTWIPVKDEVEYTDDDGNTKTGRRYEFKLSALDQSINMASYSHKYSKWYDRKVTFSFFDLASVSAGAEHQDPENPTDPTNPTNPDNPTNPTTPENPSNPSSGTQTPADQTPAQESKYESDTSGSTGKVNNVTTLADGVYTPDRFSFSGGTGKVVITCPKITVSGGQAYATLVFDSSYYTYVKANGNTYYSTKGAGTSTVVIPVELNQNNHIIGLTTKMSVPHEIAYSIFIYLAAANADGANGGSGAIAGNLDTKKLSEEAPQIIGLEYKDEVKLSHAELFKLFEYGDGIKLLEIDAKKYTADIQNVDTEKAEAKKSDEKMEEESDNAASSGNTAEDIPLEERIAKLYQGDIVRYLIVPEGVEIPAGLDKEMIVINLPIDSAYVESETEAAILQQLEVSDKIGSVGVEEKDCKDSKLAEAMKNKEIVFGGKVSDLDFKAFVKEKTDLTIISGAILPKEDDKSEDKKSDKDKKAEDKKSDKKEKSEDKKSVKDKKSEDKKDSKAKELDEMTSQEKQELFKDITQRMATLQVPLFIDRSADEKDDLAKAEWLKVYGAIFQKEDLTNQLYEKMAEGK